MGCAVEDDAKKASLVCLNWRRPPGAPLVSAGRLPDMALWVSLEWQEEMLRTMARSERIGK